jgi:hypothetical protein
MSSLRRARHEHFWSSRLNNTLILVALVGLSGVLVAHAQSDTTFLGLREIVWRDAANPGGETDIGFMPHCRQFGLGMIENLPAPGYPYFFLQPDLTSPTNRWVEATTTTHVSRGTKAAYRATFLKPSLPFC